MTPQTLPPTFRRIEMVLASSADGCGAPHRFSLIAPLNSHGEFDEGVWSQHQEACRVVRRRSDRKDDIGHLVRTPAGGWGFRYDVAAEAGDSGVRPFEAAHFTPGDQVQLREEDGLHQLHIVSVTPV